MIEIVLLQCLLSDHNHCRERYIPVLEATTVRRCMDFAEMKVNDYAKQDPLWFVRTWECSDSGKRVKRKQDI